MLARICALLLALLVNVYFWGILGTLGILDLAGPLSMLFLFSSASLWLGSLPCA